MFLFLPTKFISFVFNHLLLLFLCYPHESRFTKNFLEKNKGLFKDSFSPITWSMKERPLKCTAGGGFAYCNTFLHWGMVPRVLQITENELCLEHRNHMKTLSWSPRKICVLFCFRSFFCTKHQIFFFKWRFFLFKELSKIFKDFGGNFKDFSRISNNFSIQGLFKDMTLFQGLFRARANHVSVNIKNKAEKDMTSLKVRVLPN